MTRRIIALSGFAGVGKDTIASHLSKVYGYKRLSFASSLKDCVSNITGWNREKLEGISLEDREWRETKDEWWSEKLKRDISPRTFLTMLGTDIISKEIPDIWLLSLERKLSLDTTSNIVITDCRFNNEIHFLKNKFDASHIRVSREEPGWSEYEFPTPPLYIHQSEYEWLIDFDGRQKNFEYVFNNIHDVNSPEFERSVERMINKLQ